MLRAYFQGACSSEHTRHLVNFQQIIIWKSLLIGENGPNISTNPHALLWACITGTKERGKFFCCCHWFPKFVSGEWVLLPSFNRKFLLQSSWIQPLSLSSFVQSCLSSQIVLPQFKTPLEQLPLSITLADSLDYQEKNWSEHLPVLINCVAQVI